MAIGDVYTLQVLLLNSITGLTALNDFHFKLNGAIVQESDGADIVTAFKEAVLSSYQPCIFEDYHLDGYRVVARPSGLTVYEESDGSTNMTLAGDPLLMLAGILSYKTSHPGRSGRGRVYLGPVTEPANDSAGTPTGTYKTSVASLGDALVSIGAGDTDYASWHWGLWSAKTAAFYQRTSHTARSYWGTQRGRRR